MDKWLEVPGINEKENTNIAPTQRPVLALLEPNHRPWNANPLCVPHEEWSHSKFPSRPSCISGVHGITFFGVFVSDSCSRSLAIIFGDFGRVFNICIRNFAIIDGLVLTVFI